MAGGDYKRIRGSDFINCYLACEIDKRWRAFAYVRKQRMCWLENTIGYLSNKAGVDFGVR
jgi:serine protease Do